ncbi:MAG: AMP-binding protein, partial [Pelomonas sp.]|nr:AMP-binding protein [Roseateles sp.]
MRAFIKELASAGVQLRLEDGKLKLRSYTPGAEQPFLERIRAAREALIRHLQDSQATQPADAAAGQGGRMRPRADRGPRARTSFAQQRLWLVDRLEGGSLHYNMPMAVRVTGPFDIAVAEAAFARVVARHAPLRTVFEMDGNDTWQRIRDPLPLTLRRHDLRHLPADARDAALERLAEEDARTPFDLSQDLMLRASHVQCGDEEGVLLFNMHHIASDGWSMALLFREFAQQYDAIRQGLPDALPPLHLEYADFAEWQRNWLQGDVLVQELAYWREQLAELPPVHSLPLDRPRPEQPQFVGARSTWLIDRPMHERLRALALANQATLFMVLHTALCVLLSRHGAGSDIVVGAPVANRTQVDLEGLVGFFVNTLVLRVNLADGPRFIDALARVRDVNLQAQQHQDLPFDQLVEALNPVRSARHAPLFQIMFTMEAGPGGAQGAPATLGGVRLQVLPSPVVQAKFDLLVSATETDEGIALAIDHDVALFDASRIQGLGERFIQLLRAVCDHPVAPVHELPLLAPAEQRTLLHTRNATQAPALPEPTLTAAFEACAARHAGLTALFSEGCTLTYEALDAQANRLAAQLREEGVAADSIVGVYLDRGVDMLVAILAILKAGGAYLPLDPGYPQFRLAHMVEDSGLRWIVTEERLRRRAAQLGAPSNRPQVFCADEDLSAWPAQPPGVAVSPQDLAYVIYTSGSTGRPKGVMITHEGACNLAAFQRERFDIGPGDQVL